MKRVTPYRTFEGAARSLDNGGRLWNLFTHAGDRVITQAEIGKAGGGGGGWAGALVFFDLSTGLLKEGEREELSMRLEPKVRRRWRQSRPGRLRPHELDAADEPKRPWIVTGRARRCEKGEDGLGFLPVMVMVGNVPVQTWQPAADVRAVFEISDETGSCLALAGKRAELPEGALVRLGGTITEGRHGKEKSAGPRRYLDVRYWCPVEG